MDTNRFTPRKKLAGIYFNDRSCILHVQESRGHGDNVILIAAIQAAKRVFLDTYLGKKADKK